MPSYKKISVIIKRAEKVSLQENIFIICISLCCGIGLFLLINQFVLPKSLPLPPTSNINWLTVHNHSLFLDYIRFGLLSTIIPLATIGGWFITLWRKKQ